MIHRDCSNLYFPTLVNNRRLVLVVQIGGILNLHVPVFVQASISPQDIFVDEQVLYTLKLYFWVNVGNLSLSLPETQYASFQQLGRPLEYQATYEGRTYQVLERITV